MTKLIKYKRILPEGFTHRGEDLKIERPVLGENEHKGTVTRIMNACKDCLIEADGGVYISETSISEILRLKAEEKIRRILSNIDEEDKLENSKKAEDIDFISIGEYLYLINKEILEAKNESRRKYLRIAEQTLLNIRDCETLRLLALKNDEIYKTELKKLKGKRIKSYKIKEDELTGSPLIRRTAEFSHIRSKASYPKLALDIENGLIVNKYTHAKITKAKIENENSLKEFCIEKGWSISWFKKFKNKFE